MKVVVLPVKNLAVCKKRLSPLLSQQQRAKLMWALYLRTSQTVQRAMALESRRDSGRGAVNRMRTAVVTSDSRVADHASSLGWKVFQEKESVSESHSVDRASRLLQAEGALSVLRLPCDLPFLDPRDVLSLWKASQNIRCLLAPSRSGRGTNALLRIPPLAFPSRFGPDSRHRHQQEAAARKVELQIVERRRLALDLDRPDDLQQFLQVSPASDEIAELLRSWGIRS